MNIFYLHHNPIMAAHLQCDKHVVKMILETAQLLSTAHRLLDGDDYADSTELYKATHKNHPSAVWVRSSDLAYQWTLIHFDALLQEYTRRYGKTHKSYRLFRALQQLPTNISRTGRVPGTVTYTDRHGHRNPEWVDPPQCMPDEYKSDDTVQAYRAYYRGDKAYMAKWAYTDTPDFMRI